MPRVLNNRRLLPLTLFLWVGGCAYIFPSCATIPGCPDGSVLCTNLACVNLQNDPDNCGVCDNVCSPGLACTPLTDGGAACSCFLNGQQEYNDHCLNLAIDAFNCGAIGNVCGNGLVCYDGGCVCPYPVYFDGGCPTPEAVDGGSDGGTDGG